MHLFTWYDVELDLKRNRELWPKSWNRVDVYNNEIVINVDVKNNTESENESALKKIFANCYHDGYVQREFDKSRMDVIYEEGEEEDRMIPVRTPLFRDIYVRNENETKSAQLPIPIIAFHSYKGGVGRTLSLISLAKEISGMYEDKKRLLIIDADVEAPGLTWMLDKEQENAPISYLDLLSLMHFHDINDELAENVAKLMRKSNLVIETERLEIEQYFLPVYRKKEQMMNIFSNTERVIDIQDNKYVITEFLSMLGSALKADLVLVDLRAGITEFSAPFLFDSRVQKYFISSTSLQSIKGTQQVLEEIHEREALGLQKARVLLTMIPLEMEEQTIQRLEDRLAESIEKELDADVMSLRENYLLRVGFDSSLISLGNFEEICSVLRGRKLSDVMRGIAENLFEQEEPEDSSELSIQEIKGTLDRLSAVAESEITAEGNSSSNMLSTTSIREIVKDYKDTIPQIVVLGAKGSGKTYIYKQLAEKKTWEDFVCLVDKHAEKSSQETLIVPLLSTVSVRYINKIVQGCIQYSSDVLKDTDMGFHTVHENYDMLVELLQKGVQPAEWGKIWQRLMAQMIKGNFTNLEELDGYLEEKKKKIVFLVDGLEDLYTDIQDKAQESWKDAVRSLCRNVINILRNLKFGNIGIIIFARKDMVEETIGMNFEQFKNQYSRYELKWTPTEALRLALWIASQANAAFGKNIDILKSTREALEERLELLWGKKLGNRDSREAVSSRWIIGVLSDFTGQLQARDIVRFLKFAADASLEGKLNYRDRYLTPSGIRKAIPECSKGKFKEIKEEMKTIYKILKKFEDMDEENKRLPLTLDKISLTGEEIARLESQGYMAILEKKYYLPEIIRFALGFTYEKGARPKVLSLLAK